METDSVEATGWIDCTVVRGLGGNRVHPRRTAFVVIEDVNVQTVLFFSGPA